MTEHGVIIHFSNGIVELDDLYELEDKLRKVIDKAGAGEYDGHEIAIDGSDGFLYMYGPDADILFSTVKPVLNKTKFMKGAEICKCYGSAEQDPPEIVFTLESEND